MTYLLDTNVFIQAKNFHYGLDFCPAFWNWLIESNYSKKVFSIDKVADEIKAGDDELVGWVRDLDDGFFLKTEVKVAAQFSRLSNWVMNQNYERSATNDFLETADYFLIAHALAGDCCVVTHEMPANSPKKVKIPSVCRGLDLPFMNPFEMLRREKARFVLGVPRS